MRSSFSSHGVPAWDLPPAGGGRRGEAEAGEQTGGPCPPWAPLPTSPRWGEALALVCSPMPMTFLIDDNVYCVCHMLKVVLAISHHLARNLAFACVILRLHETGN